MTDAPVAVVGGGVVGASVAHALARRGVGSLILEAEDELALGASGTNSGILHTGFDSPPGELETRLIRRSAALRPATLRELGVDVLACGAVLRARGSDQGVAVRRLAAVAATNGVEVRPIGDGGLEVPGESVTDPVAYTLALAAASRATVLTAARVVTIERQPAGLRLVAEDGRAVTCRVAVNCAGLHADDVARTAGDPSLEIYPRKGEFFVFAAPAGRPLGRILLPVPGRGTKGVLVFPTLDGRIIAGPTAHDQDDKHDWSVRPAAHDEVLGRACAMLPDLEGAEPIACYAGLRPAGRGANYVIAPSPACPGLVNVAAIRSTGLSASLGIGEHVAGLVGALGVELGAPRPLEPVAPPPAGRPWWLRAARHHAAA